MYVLAGLIGRRGFKLKRGDQIIFKTHQRATFFPSSNATVEGSEIEIRYANFVGDKLNVIKDGKHMGLLDYSYYRYSTINLSRIDGGRDIFRLDEIGVSESYCLWKDDDVIANFTLSLNPIRIDDKYNIEILSQTYPNTVLHELFFYTGEILNRMINPRRSVFRL